MLKFLSSRQLLFCVDFSPASLAAVPYCPVGDINNILATLKQCPNYQLDKYHMNCGLRTRLLPIVEYIQAMLSSNVLAVTNISWRKNRTATAWAKDDEKNERDDNREPFRFTRSLSSDQRLRFEGAMATDRMAKQLFTAKAWDWTPGTETSGTEIRTLNGDFGGHGAAGGKLSDTPSLTGQTSVQRWQT